MVTAGEVVAELGIPHYALYRLVDKGLVPAHELPRQPWHSTKRRHLRFRLSEVREALERMAAEQDADTSR